MWRRIKYFKLVYFVCGRFKGIYNPLTLISYIRGKKISLQPVSQAAEPPALIVFVQDSDDVTTAYGELIRTVSVVVVECNDLEWRTNEGGKHKHVSVRNMQHQTGFTARAKTHQWLSRGSVCLQTDAWGKVLRKALTGQDKYTPPQWSDASVRLLILLWCDCTIVAGDCPRTHRL